MSARTFNPTAQLPEELTEAPQWICWRYGLPNDAGKRAKLPCDPVTLRNLTAWQKPGPWHSFEDACRLFHANPALAGIGIVLTPDLGIVGVDMDHAIDSATGEIAEWASEHVRDFDTYTEVSPSGTGFRLFVLGTLPDGCPKKAGHREIYNSGRWLTITGNTWNDSPMAGAREDAIGRYLDKMRGDKPATPAGKAPAIVGTIGDGDRNTTLASLGGTMRRRGMSEPAIHAALSVENQSRCNPPLAASEVASIAHSVARYAPSDVPASDSTQASIGPTLRIVDTAGGGAIPAPQFILNPLIPRRHVTLLGGHGGVGKSMLSLILAAHCACGAPWAWLAMAQGRVVFVSLEDAGDLIRWRLARIVEAYGLDAAMVAANLVILDGTEGDTALAVEDARPGGVRALKETATFAELEQASTGADLVIVDNASDAFEANENERRFVRAFMRRMLGRIARANDCGVVLMAHIDKNAAKFGGAGNNYSGSTAWHNSARSRLALVEKDGAVELIHEKANLGKKAGAIALAALEHGVLVPGGNGTTTNAGSAGDDDALLKCLADAIAGGDTITTARVGPSNAHTHAKTLPGFPIGLRRSEAFWCSTGRLERAGRLMRDSYTNKDHKDRQRWAVPPVPPVPLVA